MYTDAVYIGIRKLPTKKVGVFQCPLNIGVCRLFFSIFCGKWTKVMKYFKSGENAGSEWLETVDEAAYAVLK